MPTGLLHHFELYQSYIPFDMLNLGNALLSVAVLIFIINFRYFLMCIPFWWLFYQRPTSTSRRLYKNLPNSHSQKFEIYWSLVSSVIFALAGWVMGAEWQLGWTQIYLPLDFVPSSLGFLNPLFYLFCSAFFLACLHDTYFYFIHRALHLKPLYQWFHQTHHASLQPSPWASFSFHPVESILNAAFLPLVILFLPLHPLVILFHLTLMTVSAIFNHLGFELFPKFSQKFFVGALHHSEHHRLFRSNYGLFFTFWDLVFKTESESFKAQVEKFYSGDFFQKNKSDKSPGANPALTSGASV